MYQELTLDKQSDIYLRKDKNMDSLFEDDSNYIAQPQKGFFRIDGVKVIILVAFSALVGCLFAVLNSLNVNKIYYLSIGWILLVVALLWIGNSTISHQLNKYYPWKSYISKRFFVQLACSSIYSLICVNATYYIFKILFTETPPDLEQTLVLNIYGLLLTIPIISINFGIYFMVQWKKAFVQSENLKREQLHTQFESLKNHIDPHFLFNNLNILSSLIDKKNVQAQIFLDSFADVYRYVLQNKAAELVKVEKELEFLESYVYMLKQRFSGALHLEVAIPEKSKKKYIPPLSLQMLIENIVKHNVISEDSKLKINVFVEDNRYLVVKNTLKRKKPDKYSSQSGLKNISKRYNYLSDEVIQIIDDNETFTIKLPLLNFV